MAGIFQDRKFWRRKIQSENQPYRTSSTGGRRGCLGDASDPFPGEYNPANCNGKRLNQRY